MKQTTLSTHFPSVKPDLDSATRKRKHKENDDESLHVSKILKLEPTQTQRVDPRICKSLNGDFEKSASEPIQAQKLKVLLTPPSQVPLLSQKTQDLIETLKKRNLDRPRKEVDEVLSSVTAKEKYQDLLDPQRALALPYKYRRLLDLLEAADTSLNCEIRLKNHISFENIKRAVSETYKLKFDLTQLQQMLYVIPTIYRMTWLKKNAREFDLIMDFPENLPKIENQITRDLIEVRKSHFRKGLIEIIKQYHEAFLSSLPSRPQIDPEKLKTWHSSFDLHNLPDLPLKDLPDKPDSPVIPNISDIYELGFSRNKLLKNVFEGISENKEINIAETPVTGENTPIKGLSLEISNQILAKEAAFIEESLQMESPEKKAKQVRAQRLINMCELMKALFSVHKTPSIFFSCLVKKIKNNCKGLAKEVIEEDVKEIVDLFPNWISIFNTNSGDVVRMNRKHEAMMVDLIEEIQKKYN
ncbi:unnamed protein product [Blepharisma stoltei]|uniref:CDT1 Geminin-binding domain-containing protein n=1 Tax=Blepharisma stoltei TaxID=1481888 RepID=A0AAU9IYM2_9CILI|nr:unnamed protein product [Blepharisma stoltei]